jgi:hypothetical protein
MINAISCQMQHMKSKHDESQFDRLWSLNMHSDPNNQSWHYGPDHYKNKHNKCIFWPPESFKVHCCGLGQPKQQDKDGTNMAICLYSSVLLYRSCGLCWLYVLFALCACRNRSQTTSMR